MPTSRPLAPYGATTRCLLAIAATAAITTAQAHLDLDGRLLLPAPPTVGPLQFAADGSCSRQQPEPVDAYGLLSPLHQAMLRSVSDRRDQQEHVLGCWLDPVAPQVASLFNAAIMGPQGFQLSNRWTSTATQPSGFNTGDPTVLTVSFVPDGTYLPNGVGEGAGTSNLFAAFNGSFPSQATWQNRIIAAFTAWGDLTGTSYVFEPNDDGAPMFNTSGALGVRGDVRIGGKFVDGNNGILAYNFYPNGGDMVIDTGDLSWYANSSGNYRRLFNVVAHEHGHGLGLDHVCPADGTKLMEPYATTGYEGPQFDDVMSGQRFYGDRFENNDSGATATDLGTLGNGLTTVTNVSNDGSTDQDYFKFTVTGDKMLTITVHPAGSPYLEGPQVGNCTTGTSLDPRLMRNLSIVLMNGTATGVITFSTTAPIGVDEVISGYAVTAGTYQARVTGSGTDTIQMYELSIDVVDNGPVAAATLVGSSCGGLAWNALNRPLLGTSQMILMTGINTPAASIGIVLLGYGQIPGGFDLGLLGAPGCTLYCDFVDMQTAFPLFSSSFLWQLPIPNNQALAGSVLMTQGGTLVGTGVNPLGVLTANGVQLTLGTQ